MNNDDACVYIVDDDPEVRLAIEQLVVSVGLIVKTYSSADDFLKSAACDELSGCLITDVRMPGISGLELQRTVGDRLPVIIMTAYAEVPMTIRAFKDGVFDFIQKPFRPQLLLETIHKAISRHRRQKEREKEKSAIEAKLAQLSQRETEVMDLLVKGKTTKQIAARLDIGLTTVDFHRNNVLKKMDVDNVVELTHAVDVVKLSVE